MTSPASAAPSEEQLKALQAQVSQLQHQIDQMSLDIKNARGVANDAKSQASNVKVTLGPGPQITTADGDTSFKIGGFAQMDAGAFHDDRADNPDGTNVRRARLNVSGTIAHDWKYKMENDFANNGTTNNASITDLFVQYDGFAPVSIIAGQFKEPFGLETLTSDLFTSFMERSLTYAFSPDRNMGFMVSSYGDSPVGKWTAALGGFGANISTASTNDESHDLTGRLTLAPIAEGDKVLHLGAAVSRRTPDGGTHAYRVQSRAENSLTSVQDVDTGSLTHVNQTMLYGLEAAGVWGPASVQGEYVRANVGRRDGFSDPHFSGYYAEASYFLTGESRNYLPNLGRFDRVTPKHPFSLNQSGWGAWQVMARFSDLDLNDAGAGVLGGELKDITVGTRWQPTANLAFLANYIHEHNDSHAISPGDDPDIWMIRAQYDF